MAREDFGELAHELRDGLSPAAAATHARESAALAAELDARRVLGEAIAAAREHASLTQATLAVAAGVQQADISRIERGLANPTAATLHRLVAALGRRLAVV